MRISVKVIRQVHEVFGVIFRTIINLVFFVKFYIAHEKGFLREDLGFSTIISLRIMNLFVLHMIYCYCYV